MLEKIKESNFADIDSFKNITEINCAEFGEVQENNRSNKILEKRKRIKNYLNSNKKFEEKTKEIISETLEKFKDSLKKEKDLFNDNTDSEYWFTVCFQTRKQKEEFLRKTGLIKFGDKYLEGEKVAEKLGVELENKTPIIRKVKISEDYKKLVEKQI